MLPSCHGLLHSLPFFDHGQVVLVVKNLPANTVDVRDAVSIPGPGRCPGGGQGNPLQYSFLENPMHGGTWQATVHGVPKSQTQLKRLSSSSRFKNKLDNQQASLIAHWSRTHLQSLCRRQRRPGFVPWVGKIPWRRSLEGRDLEAIHSSMLAWKIPWMEEPGRLQSMGSQKVRHD